MGLLSNCTKSAFLILSRGITNQGKLKMEAVKSGSLIPGVYHSFKAVSKVLEKYSDLEEVQRLLEIHEEYRIKENSVTEGADRRHPFIVFEGIDGCGKSRMTRELSRVIGAELSSTPPKCLLQLRPTFDTHDELLRRAYYAVGNYIAASQVKLQTLKTPVVMDRFWHSTGVYAIANEWRKTGREVPHSNDAVYCWPGDLFAPQLVIYLDVLEEIRLKRLSSRKTFTAEEDRLKANEAFRQRVVLAYQRMRDPGVTFVNGNGTIEQTLDNILAVVKPYLNT